MDPEILLSRSAVIGHFIGGSKDRSGSKVEILQLEIIPSTR